MLIAKLVKHPKGLLRINVHVKSKLLHVCLCLMFVVCFFVLRRFFIFLLKRQLKVALPLSGLLLVPVFLRITVVEKSYHLYRPIGKVPRVALLLTLLGHPLSYTELHLRMSSSAPQILSNFAYKCIPVIAQQCSIILKSFNYVALTSYIFVMISEVFFTLMNLYLEVHVFIDFVNHEFVYFELVTLVTFKHRDCWIVTSKSQT